MPETRIYLPESMGWIVLPDRLGPPAHTPPYFVPDFHAWAKAIAAPIAAHLAAHLAAQLSVPHTEGQRHHATLAGHRGRRCRGDDRRNLRCDPARKPLGRPQVALAAQDPAAIQAVIDHINSNASTLAAAVTANTPTPPAPPAAA